MNHIEVTFHYRELGRLRSWLLAYGKMAGVLCRRLYHPYYNVALDKSDYEEYRIDTREKNI